MQSRPIILGILNITTDSFSDGNLYFETTKAVARAKELISQGADIIDLGAASSHPQAKKVLPATEIKRLSRVLEKMESVVDKQKISIDSYEPEVQRFAIKQSVGYLNDIRAFANPEIYSQIAMASAKLILMYQNQPNHLKKTPHQYFQDMLVFLEKRAEQLLQANISQKRLILDPGMGLFLSPDPAVSIYFLNHLTDLKEKLGLPILISVSRKSFLGEISGRPVTQRQIPTLLAELRAHFHHDIDYLRTHDVELFLYGKKIWNSLVGK